MEATRADLSERSIAEKRPFSVEVSANESKGIAHSLASDHDHADVSEVQEESTEASQNVTVAPETIQLVEPVLTVNVSESGGGDVTSVKAESIRSQDAAFEAKNLIFEQKQCMGWLFRGGGVSHDRIITWVKYSSGRWVVTMATRMYPNRPIAARRHRRIFHLRDDGAILQLMCPVCNYDRYIPGCLAQAIISGRLLQNILSTLNICVANNRMPI
jgi:hypothetical protein